MLRSKSGVYIWINLSNNNCYVGSSSNLSKRFSWYYDFNNLNKLLKNSTSLNPLLNYRHEKFRLKIHPVISRRINYFSSKSTGVIPVKMYANADIQKAQIIKPRPPLLRSGWGCPGGLENKKCAGVYRWTHLPSGNCYIGSSINLSGRFSQYYNIDYLANKHGKSHIRRSLLYNGYSLFSLEVLEYCAPEKVIEREQYYLDLLKPEYNILKTAGSLLGYKHPEGGKTKNWTPERKADRRKRLIVLNTSKEQTERARERMKIYSNSKEHQEHLQKIHLRQSHKVEVFDIISETTNVYSSIRSAALEIGIAHSTIRKYLRLGKPYKNKYKFSCDNPSSGKD